MIFIYNILVYNTTAVSKPHVSLDIKNVGHDEYLNLNRLNANVSLDVPGHMTYVEEYYTIDGNSNPKLCCSGTYFDGQLIQYNDANDTNITYYNASFDILRPKPNKGKTYTLTKAIILLDGSRIYEKWLTKNVTFIDNTVSGINGGSTIGNIDTYETRENILSNQPVTFVYTSLGSIYEINATGNGQTSLRVEILKDAPSGTHLSKGIAYKYANIITDNYNINQLFLRFKIENSWITNGNISSLGLFVWYNENKIWNSLPTKQINKDNNYMYFESEYNISNTPIAIIGIGPKGNKTISNDSDIYVGNGGDGVTSTEPSSNIIRYESLISDIGHFPVTYSLSSPEFSIYQVIVTDKVNEKGIVLRIEHLKNVSALVSKIPEGTIYANENVWIESNKIDSTLVRFKVKNSWITENSIPKEGIQLLRFSNGWKRSPTNITNVDSNYTYFESRTSGLSPFAISGFVNSNVSIPVEDSANATKTNITIPIETPRNVTVKQSKDTPGFGFISVLGIISLLYILIKRKR